MDVDLESENLNILFELKDFKTISYDINSLCDYNQNFCFIKAIKGDYYLVFADTKNNLQIYDLNKEVVVQKTKVHNDWINSVHHIYDPFLNRDIIITSSDDKTLKLWQADFYLNNHSLKNILTIKNETVGMYRNAFMFSDFKEKKNYIIAELSDYIVAVYSQEGNFIYKIENAYFLDIWIDVKNSRTHLITSYAGEVKFYDLFSGELTKQFTSHGRLAVGAVVNDLLIMADESGVIRTFDICHHKLMNEEVVSEVPVEELIIWDIEYFVTGLVNGQIEFYETKTLTKIRTIDTGCERVMYTLPFVHPLKGPSIAISGPVGLDKSILTILSVCEEDKNKNVL